MIRNVLTILLISLISISLAQTDSIPLTPNFVFKDGIFLTFYDLKHNNPIPRTNIITNIPQWDLEFYTKVLEPANLEVIIDNQNVTIETDKIWGYSDNGTVYIKVQDDFAKIITKGALCQFATNQLIETYDYQLYDPLLISSGYSKERYRELRQYIIDCQTGVIYPFNAYSLLQIFKGYDPQLYEEYSKLRVRKRNKLTFVYLKKFNQRHTIYILQTKQ